MSGRHWFAAAAMAIALGVACSDTNSLVGSGQNVSLSFAGRNPGATGVLAAVAAGDSMIIAVGTDTLILTSVQIVLREIEMQKVGVAISCDSVAGAEKGCEEFEAGATLVQVPLAAGAVTAVTIPVDSGTYTKVEFKVHKPGNDSVDLAFKAANPTWPANTSIQATGRFNHTAFTYLTSLDAGQEFTFSPPLVIDASGTTTNLTLRTDVSLWFKTAGGALINPSTANSGQPNQSLVANNIQNSFKSFRDENKDGNEGTP